MERPFGAEIELAGMTRQRALHILRLVGFDIRDEGYNHDTRTWWKIVPDASVTNGFEVVSPILHGTEGVEALKDVVTALDDAGGSVNRVCGLHVHMDGRNLEVRHIRSIVQRYARFEDEIDAFMSESVLPTRQVVVETRISIAEPCEILRQMNTSCGRIRWPASWPRRVDDITK